MKHTLCTIAIFIACIFSLFSQQGYVPSELNIQAREEFRNAGLGIFIHWGIYSMLGDGEWVMSNRDIHYKEYGKLAGGFYPAQFNAHQWVKDIKASGAEYICITTRHHDGFSMFYTQYSPYNIMDATPFKRDIIKEIAEACQQEGIRLHFYYSLIDWGRTDAPRGRTGVGTGRPAWDGNYEPYFSFMKNQLTELLSNYGPIGAIWLDGDWDMPRDFNWKYDELYMHIHQLQPACLIANNHHLKPQPGEDIQIFERDLPGENTAGYSGESGISNLPLETCQTMNRRWGYDINDLNYKSANTLIQYLVGAAGRGANLLLNIGPRPDGTLPDLAVERLHQIGEWMKKHGHTIKGTTAGDISPRTWGVTTRKGNKLYVHVIQQEDNVVYLPLKIKVKKAICLNDGKKTDFTQDKSNGVILQLRPTNEPVNIIELTTYEK